MLRNRSTILLVTALLLGHAWSCTEKNSTSGPNDNGPPNEPPRIEQIAFKTWDEPFKVEVRVIDESEIPDSNIIWYNEVGDTLNQGPVYEMSSYTWGRYPIRIIATDSFGQGDTLEAVMQVFPALNDTTGASVFYYSDHAYQDTVSPECNADQFQMGVFLGRESVSISPSTFCFSHNITISQGPSSPVSFGLDTNMANWSREWSNTELSKDGNVVSYHIDFVSHPRHGSLYDWRDEEWLSNCEWWTSVRYDILLEYVGDVPCGLANVCWKWGGSCGGDWFRVGVGTTFCFNTILPISGVAIDTTD